MVPSFCLPPKSFWTWKTFKKDTRAAFDEILKKFEDDEWDMAFVYYEAVDAIGTVFYLWSISQCFVIFFIFIFLFLFITCFRSCIWQRD